METCDLNFNLLITTDGTREVTSRELARKIKLMAQNLGYVDCGIASTDPFLEYAGIIDRRRNDFPESANMYESLRQRAFPGENNSWAESIVACVRWYGKYKIPEGISDGIGRSYLFDRRYKKNPDHDMPKKMKAGLRELGLKVRTGGVPDRWAAARAGIARFGRNNFVYTEKHGSWINIETWLVDRKMPEDEPCYEPLCPDSCSRCIDNCPTGAIESPFCMRWDRCVAYLTYSAPEPVEDDLWGAMGPWVYGCDQCQLVCPLNEGKWCELEQADWLEDIAPYLSNEALANMEEETYRSIVHPAFWYIPPGMVERWRRNARRALSVRRLG